MQCSASSVCKLVILLFGATVSSAASAQYVSIPEPNFTPDLILKIDTNLFETELENTIPKRFHYNREEIDFRKTKEIRAHVVPKKCHGSNEQFVQLGFLSLKDRNRRTIVTHKGDQWELDSLLTQLAFNVKAEKGQISVSVSMAVSYAQNTDWPAWLLLTVNDKIQRDLNPKIPRPLYTVKFKDPLSPYKHGLKNTGIKFVGCAGDEDRHLEVWFEFQRLGHQGLSADVEPSGTKEIQPVKSQQPNIAPFGLVDFCVYHSEVYSVGSKLQVSETATITCASTGIWE